MDYIRVVLADDHPIVRAGFRSLLEKASDIIVVGEASDGIEAVHLVKEMKPDVLLLDIDMPGFTGVDVAKQIHEAKLPVQILALSSYDDEEYVFGLLEYGAAGYLTKEEAMEKIAEAVRGVANGEEGWLSRRATATLLKRKKAALKYDQLSPLTQRETEVLKLLAEGYTNAQIAEKIIVSEGTARNHIMKIYAKLGMHSRAEVVAWAWKQGVIKKI